MAFKIKGSRIVVTGGTGSVGRAIVRRLLELEARTVRVLSRDESKQFEMGLEFAEEEARLRYLVGDVRDRRRLARALNGADAVIHTAALKHVPSCEYNPYEAVQTNVLGVQNIIEAAIRCGVKRVVNLSTDKAAMPDNTMGASKLLGEKLITAGNYQNAAAGSLFASTRFGNVLGSRGSVLTVVRELVTEGKPVPITDPAMTRFVLTPKGAVDLVLDALTNMLGGEVFVRKMPVVKLGDLIEVYAECVARELGRDPASVEFKTIGFRPGETLYEDLVTEEEGKRTLETETDYVVLPAFRFRRVEYKHPGAKEAKITGYNSHQQTPLTRDEVRAFLADGGLVKG